MQQSMCETRAFACRCVAGCGVRPRVDEIDCSVANLEVAAASNGIEAIRVQSRYPAFALYARAISITGDRV